MFTLETPADFITIFSTKLMVISKTLQNVLIPEAVQELEKFWSEITTRYDFILTVPGDLPA